ncbi:MAG: restriction endonuclease subunit S [Candidatus Omnitrophica bacterium]|nr:restriction endonuclease subunit S [Candidatus Omnitrophota bacterium]
MVKDTSISKGYKQTEVGVIPTGWEVKPMAELTSLMTNGFVGTVKSHYANYENGILYIQGYNVEENSFNFHGIKRVSHEFHNQHSKSCLREGDLLTIQTGDIGVTTVVPKELEGANCHALIITRFKNHLAEPRFYSYYFNYSEGRKRLKEIETGSTMKHINVGDMVQMLIPHPPKTEQTAVVTVLSDTDRLIAVTEKLIAKKRNIKQGAMQELFTGKKHLPGFSEKWEMRLMGKLGKTYGGLSGKSKDDFQNGECPYIPFLNILNNPVIDTQYFDYVNLKPEENQNRAQKGDLFFNGSSETPEEVGMCSVLLDDVPNLCLNSFCFGFRLNNEIKVSGLYLSYFFRSDVGRRLVFFLAQGATRHNLSKTSFMKLEIPYPSYEEQVAIAQVLSDMDIGIKQLEKKLAKYRLIKQGMMQELLIGKTRLI